MSLLLLALLLLTGWHAQPATAQQAQNTTLCGQSEFYNSTVVPYSFNNNAWGDNGQGYSCLNIFDDDKAFTVTYQWTGDSSTVKGFPYMKAHPSRLPVQLWNISSLDFAAQFRTYVRGSEQWSEEEQAVAMDNTALRVNTAVDMFLSDDAENSTGLGAPIEIMVWQWYTPTVLPLGHAESTPDVDTVEVAGTNYSLYHGYNAQGQHVFSWLPHRNLTSVDADYSPLLRYIWEEGLLSGALYVGQLEFGTEIMHAGEETVFAASEYTLKITRDGDPDAPVRPKTTSTSSATTTRPTRSSSSTASTSSQTGPASVAASQTTDGAAATATANAASSTSMSRLQSAVGGVYLLSGLWLAPLLLAGWYRFDR